MHELPVTRGILESVLRSAAASNAARVTAVHLVVGDRSGVSPECVEFYWQAIARGTLAEGASLNVRVLPFELMCLDCARAFHPTEIALGYECPTCGGVNVRVSHGQECCVEAIDIDEVEQPDGGDPASAQIGDARSPA